MVNAAPGKIKAPKAPKKNFRFNSDIALIPLSIIYSLLYDFVYGIKYIFADLLPILFNAAANEVDKVYKKRIKKDENASFKKDNFIVKQWNKLSFVREKRRKLEQQSAELLRT